MLTVDANIWIAVYDPHDFFHAESTTFLATVAGRRLALYAPTFAALEVGCALARRAQAASAGSTAIQRLNVYPLLTWLPLNDQLLKTAGELGVRYLLRGADALYAATAALTDTQLVSWDVELVRRAGAVTPADWLAANAQ